MLRNNLYLFLITVMVVWGSACKKDISSLNQEKINEVTITTDTESYAITQLDSLKITPHLAESKVGDRYTYQWKIYPQFSDLSEASILSTERDLKAKISLSPGTYQMQYKVTSTTSGVSSFLLYTIVVNGAFYEGWNVSNNKDGKAQLSFIRADDQVFYNPVDVVNNKTYSGKVTSAYSATYYDGFAFTYFFTDQGVYRLNANNLLQIGETKDITPGEKQFSGHTAYGLGRFGLDQYIISNGGLFVGMGPGFYDQEVLKPFSERLAGDYSLFPGVIACSSDFNYFYDNKYMRFMQVDFLGRTINIASATPSDNFNLSNVGKTMIAMDYGQLDYFSDEIYFIMVDHTGKRYLYSIVGTDPGVNQLIDNSQDIDKAIAFATSSLVKHMYYATENKIYLYDMLANSSRLLYTFPSGYKIKDIEMLRATSKRLVVGVDKGAAGEIYYFDMDNLGDFVGNTYVKKIEGFGEIVHLSYRPL